MKRKSSNNGPTLQKTLKMNRPSTTPAPSVKTEEVNELQRLRQQVKHLQREAEERDDNMDALIEDNRRLTRLVQSLKKDVNDRDAEIADLKTRPGEERCNSLEKRVSSLQLKVENLDSQIAELQKKPPTTTQLINTRLERLRALNTEVYDADKAIYDFNCSFSDRVALRERMSNSRKTIYTLMNYAEEYVEEVYEEQVELDYKLDKVYDFVKGLLKDSQEYYSNIADPKVFVSQVREKLNQRRETLIPMFGEVETAMGYSSAAINMKINEEYDPNVFTRIRKTVRYVY